MPYTFGGFALKSIAIGCATYLTNNYLASFVICTGPSMEPTLQTGNVLLTDQISPRLGWIDIGDVVIARSPENDNTRVCKRIAGMEGDLVIFKSKLFQVPQGHVWLLGDNKSNSNDSRTYGPVRMDQIRSRCLCRIYPDINRVVLYEVKPPLKYSYDGGHDPASTTISQSLLQWFKSLDREYGTSQDDKDKKQKFKD